MHIQINFYSTDESFDYDGTFGTQTHQVTGVHGIEFDVDSNNNIDWSSLNGFGDLCIDYKKIKPFRTELYKYIEENWTPETEVLTGHSIDSFQELLEVA